MIHRAGLVNTPELTYLRSMTSTVPQPDAFSVLERLLDKDFSPKHIDEVHEQLKLLGLVLGRFVLLEVAANSSDDKARVTAARALATLKENPSDIAERLRRSPFAHLTVQELQDIVERVRQGESLSDLIHSDNED